MAWDPGSVLDPGFRITFAAHHAIIDHTECKRDAVAAGTYYLVMSARLGGIPICSTVPPSGVTLPYAVTVTHP
jgi:hypothetical protein